MTNPKTKISDKAQLATDHYIANMIIAPVIGFTWAMAMKKAGYAQSTIDKQGARVSGLVGVQSQIEAAKAQIAVKAETIRDEVTRMFRTGYEIAKKQGNPSGISANAIGLSRMNGLLTDNINSENKVLGITVNVKE